MNLKGKFVFVLFFFINLKVIKFWLVLVFYEGKEDVVVVFVFFWIDMFDFGIDVRIEIFYF